MHYLLLVNAMHIQLGSGSTNQDVDIAETYLLEFAKTLVVNFMTRFIRLNVHQLLHLPDSLRNLDPLYTHS